MRKMYKCRLITKRVKIVKANVQKYIVYEVAMGGVSLDIVLYCVSLFLVVYLFMCYKYLALPSLCLLSAFVAALHFFRAAAGDAGCLRETAACNHRT